MDEDTKILVALLENTASRMDTEYPLVGRAQREIMRSSCIWLMRYTARQLREASVLEP